MLTALTGSTIVGSDPVSNSLPQMAKLKFIALTLTGAYIAGCSTSSADRMSVAVLPPITDSSQRQRSNSLTARFFGTTTIALTDGTTTIVTDGFFSRPSLNKFLFGPLEPDAKRIFAAIDYGGLNEVDAVFVAHSHHDHAMDSAYVANLTSSVVVGSPSTANIARGMKLPENRIAEIADGSVCQFGAFTVTAFATPHSKPKLFRGRIDIPLSHPAKAGAYREGGNFSFHVAHPWGNVLIVPSRGVRRDWKVPFDADVVFLGIGGFISGKQKLRPYWEQFVTGSNATRIYPIHYDNFFKPIQFGPVQEKSRGLGRKLRILQGLAEPEQFVEVLPVDDAVVLYAPGGGTKRLAPSPLGGCRSKETS